MGVRCDLHVHSKYSVKPTNWIISRFGCPESFIEPKNIYDIAVSRGMTHVTITDHNNIRGAVKLMELGHSNTFVSCEVTTYFPQDGCKIHVLVYNITEDHFKEIMKLRKDIYELVRYLRSENVWHAIAHPLYSVNNKLTQNHLEQILVMFDLIELNGFRSKDTNNIIRSMVNCISDKTLMKFADKYDIEYPLTIRNNKKFIRGTDDHSGVFIGRAYTENCSGDSISAFFNSSNQNIICGENGTPKDLAYALYSIGYQYLDKNFDVKKYARRNDAVRLVSRLLIPEETNDGGLVDFLIKRYKGNDFKIDGNLKDTILYTISKIRDDGHLKSGDLPEKWFELLSKATDNTIKSMLDYLVEQINNKNIFSIFQTIGNVASLYFLTIFYYVSYFVFQQTRNFSVSLDFGEDFKSIPANKKVGHFTDTFYEINGVVKTLKQAQITAHKFGIDYTFVTCYNRDPELNEKVFKPVKEYNIPGYEEIPINIPPILNILEYSYQENFTHIHTATPGPMGLVGMLVARVLQKPLYSTYHTAFPQYIDAALKDDFMTGATWQYMRWYYNQCDKIFVPSRALMLDLKNHGIDESKMCLFLRGIDTESFRPAEKMEDDKFYLLYVGRVSKEKNLDILAEAFKKLDNPKVELIIVGDGPYRDKMEGKLKGFSATFTGYLHGDALVQAYQNADVFVFPSTTDTFGNVILEAHACGLPTIVTDVGGPSENVTHGENGLIVAGDDVYALKEGILSMLDKNKIKTMGKKARDLVKDKTFDNAFIEWLKFYE